ncbi:putative membrane protein [Marinobacterium lacunae]|uniref:Putative membrane protein n=1 Tax=Marinobacterium lacunae TaxID=1232683 RepID=A0A081G2D4_9GAMM|nr:YdcF family protein [Marinobacterium lacunae]KEA64939.1 putative membrane protein [Marinobacterium lacunae]
MDSFFNLSKLFWFFARPDHFLVWMLLLGLFSLWVGWRRLGIGLLVGDLVLLLCIMLMPLGDALMMPLESRFPQPDRNLKVDGIIVLGGGELAEESVYWHQPQINQAGERLMLIPVLAHQFPKAKILFSGGSGSVLRPEFKGGDVAKAYLDSAGLSGRVLIERDSRNTHENAINTIKLLGGVPKGNWLLVTSAYHMPRSIGIFRRQGWELTPYPVDYYALSDDGLHLAPGLWNNLSEIEIALREWVGLLAYYLSGKTSQLLPGPLPAPESEAL